MPFHAISWQVMPIHGSDSAWECLKVPDFARKTPTCCSPVWVMPTQRAQELKTSSYFESKRRWMQTFPELSLSLSQATQIPNIMIITSLYIQHSAQNTICNARITTNITPLEMFDVIHMNLYIKWLPQHYLMQWSCKSFAKRSLVRGAHPMNYEKHFGRIFWCKPRWNNCEKCHSWKLINVILEL